MALGRCGLLIGCALGASLSCTGDGPIEAPDRAQEGYILFSPLLSCTTYLVDKAGNAVHTWQSALPPGVSSYLLDNGHLLRCARQQGGTRFRQGGEGGRIQEFGWEGELLWDWALASDEKLQHHDIAPMPNGNVLLIAWELKTREQAVLAGRDPELVDSAGLWSDFVVEVRPEAPDRGQVVWEWHVWDHLTQELDRRCDNYGSVREHIELVDINGSRPREKLSEWALRRLRALGYMATGSAQDDRLADFMHTNSIAYNPRLDQIVLSVPNFNEIWIIDHSTTTGESASHTGGRCGRGGDLVYRWGNPQAYGRGGTLDQQLFAQHDARWIPEGFPGAGNLTIFNNGTGRPGGDHSSVIEIDPPSAADGCYSLGSEGRFGPQRPVWEHAAPERRSFFADFISGAQRLPNGNTLVCSGPEGRFFEVTSKGQIVWKYDNPYSGNAPNPHGDPPFSVFRATLIPPDHAALGGRDLRPLDPQPPRMRGRRRG
jgi:hypothetical protein